MIELMDQSERDMLSADLCSGQPERVAGALETLDRAWRQRRFGPLPMPEPDCLDAFGDLVPDEVLSRYLTVLQHYPDFEPTPSLKDIRYALAEAMIRYGCGEHAHDVALALQIDDFPESAVSDVLRYLQHRGLYGPYETLAAQRLVDYLLDSDKTRRATVDILRFWVMTDRFPEVIDAARPRLNNEERARLDVNSED
jgi:hypothetical protein